MCWQALAIGFTLAAPVIQGFQAADQYEAEAKQAAEAARDAKVEAALRRKDREQRQREQIAAIRARAGASGFSPDVGSPLDAQSYTASEFGKEQFLDDYQTNRQIKSLKTSAKNLQKSGKNAIIGGFLEGGSNLAAYGIRG